MTLRSQILTHTELPFMNQIFSLIIQEEKQKSNFNEKIGSSPSAMFAKNNAKKKRT